MKEINLPSVLQEIGKYALWYCKSLIGIILFYCDKVGRKSREKIIALLLELILSAEDNFATLANLEVVKDANGRPVMSSGNFAVVFKMWDTSTDKCYV